MLRSLFERSSVVGEGSVCHTDGAKACKTLASPLYDGSLEKFPLKLSHTCVRHHSGVFEGMCVLVWNGSEFLEEIRMGGTQKLDGFFASFRGTSEAVKSVWSGRFSDPRMEQLMHYAVRSFLLKFLVRARTFYRRPEVPS